MKLACVTTVRIPATTANSVQVMKACAALGENGHDVRLWVPGFASLQVAGLETERHQTFKPSNLQTLYGLSTSFPVEHLPARPRLKRYDFCWNAVQAARRWGADAVYTWAIQAGVFALLRKLPVLLELHGPPEGSLGPLLFRLFLALPGKKRILPISQALLNLLTPYGTRYTLHAPAKASTPKLANASVSIVISPNGVELARFANLPLPVEARQQLGLPERLTVGYTGHFYAGRGMELMAELAHRLPGVQFLWVGGNPEDVETWRGRLTAQGITNVILTGFIENSRLPLYQAAADVLIMPYERVITGSGGGNSAAYCSPMKMFEYMACGRAIISSDLPVIGEILTASNAVRCPPENADAWIRAITDLLNAPARRAALAAQALADVQRYTWQARAQRAMEGFL
jgi:glycosyltransferase involved in cell wall biosynthesis